MPREPVPAMGERVARYVVGGGVTFTVKDIGAEKAKPSETYKVMVTGTIEVIPAAGVRVIVREAPVPVIEILLLGMVIWSLEVAVTTSVLAADSASATVKPTGDIAVPVTTA